MKFIVTTLILIIQVSFLYSQTDSLERNVEYPGGVNALAIHFYDIEFSPERRAKLVGQRIELVFLVDESGASELRAINNVDDKVVIDSLRQRAESLESFNPAMHQGAASMSSYSLVFEFPSYRLSQRQEARQLSWRYQETKLEDFTSITYSNQRLDVLFGGAANYWLGNAGEYLKLGGGMNVEVDYTDRKKRIYGLNMRFHGNGKRKDYPIQTEREFNKEMVTGNLGIVFGKWLSNGMSLTGHLSFAQQNITPSLGDDDNGWLKASGWSLGTMATYPLQIGKRSATYYYGQPSVTAHHIDLNFGLFYNHFDLNEARGMMLQIGAGYRLSQFIVSAYEIPSLQ